MNIIEELLSKKAKSPTPHLDTDPYLATKIAALATEEISTTKIAGVPTWSFASVITALGLILGIYLGIGIQENSTIQNDLDIVDEFSQAFYQNGFADSFDSSLENGDK